MSLAAARRSLALENSTGQPGRHDAVSPRYYDSEDATLMESRIPGGSTPFKLPGTHSEMGAGKETNGTLYAVSNLTKEFEQKRQSFDDDAKALLEVRSGNPASMNLNEDFRKLKHRFQVWKREYKSRLRETKFKLIRTGSPEAEVTCRKWWGKISQRGL